MSPAHPSPWPAVNVLSGCLERLPLSPVNHLLKKGRGWRGDKKEKKNSSWDRRSGFYQIFVAFSLCKLKLPVTSPFKRRPPPVSFYFLPALISLPSPSISPTVPMNYPAIMRHFGILWGWRVTMLIAASQRVCASPHGRSFGQEGRRIRRRFSFHFRYWIHCQFKTEKINKISCNINSSWSFIFVQKNKRGHR